MFAVRKNVLFGISGVTFDVSSCTKFHIFLGSTPDPTWGAYRPWKCIFWVLENPAIWSSW